MQLTHLSPDVISLAIIAGGVAYGVFRGAPGVRIAILAAAAGFVAATQLASYIPKSAGLPDGTIQVAIVAAVILAFGLTQHRPIRHGSVMVGAIGGGVAGVFALSMALTAVPSASRAWLTSNSLILAEVQSLQVVILMVALGVGIAIPLFYHHQARSHH